MKEINKALNDVGFDMRTTIRGLKPHILMGSTIRPEKRECIRDLNERFSETKDKEMVALGEIDALIDDAIVDAIKMEEWYENDFNEAWNIAKGIGIAALAGVAAAGVALVFPIAGGALTYLQSEREL